MQRLHEDDLVGHVLEQEDWEVVSFPAIAEQDETDLIDTPCRPVHRGRKAGEALHPAHESLETLATLRPTLGKYNFVAQYLPAPTQAQR